MLDEEEKKTEVADEVSDKYLETEPIEESGKKYSIPWLGFVIVFGVLAICIAVCVIVIVLNGGFYQW